MDQATLDGSQLVSQTTWNFGQGFQEKVIALMLRDPDFLSRNLDVISASYFDLDPLSTLCHLIINHHQTYTMIPTKDSMVAAVNEYATQYGAGDSHNIRTTLSGWLEYIYALDLSDVQFVQDKILQFGRDQHLKHAVAQTITILERGQGSYDRIRSLFEQALQVGGTRDIGLSIKGVGTGLPDLVREDPVYGLKNKVPTGLSRLDHALLGGMGAGELGVVAGPPGRGKSTLLTSFGKFAAVHFRQHGIQKVVVHLSFELKRPAVLLMYGSGITGIPKNEILQNSDEYKERWKSAEGYLSDIYVQYFTAGTKTTDELRWYLGNLRAIHGVTPGMLIVDYADKLRGGEQDRYRGMSEIYQGLIGIGDKFEIPVWTGSQINREWSNAEVVTGQGLAESWLKKADCDVLITICQNEKEYHEKRCRLWLDKVRSAEGMSLIHCHHRGDMASIWEMSEADMQAAGIGLKQEEDAGSTAKGS